MSNEVVPGKLGKLAPKFSASTKKLASYINPAELPALPGSVVRSDLVKAWGMMVNNRLGNCTIAAAGHGEQITSAAISKGAQVHTPSDAQIEAAYWATGTEDDGRAELDILNFWTNEGIGDSKIEGFVSIVPNSTAFHQTEYAIDLFGFAYIGVALPLSAQAQTSQGLWKKVEGPGSDPGSWGGHAIILVDYDDVTGPTCVTWGQTLKMTWDFYETYCDEAYAVILPEWFDTTGKDLAGFALGDLQSDLKSLSSQ